MFEYTARNRAGELIEAEVDGFSRLSVATELIEAGIIPILITHARAPEPDVLEWVQRRWASRQVGSAELVPLCRQLHTLVRAGVPLRRAISGIAATVRNPALGASLKEVGESLEAGRELHESFERHPAIFSSLFVSIVEVGENTGRLDEAFSQIAQYLTLDYQTRKQIKSATRYPTVVLGVITAAVVLINLFVVPSFAKFFDKFDAELPWATQLLVGMSDFMVVYWPHLLAGVVGGVAAARAYVRTPPGRYLWDRYKLALPVVGGIVTRATIARYARSFSMAFTAGVPLIRTLELVGRTVDNAFIQRRLHAMRECIERGETMTVAASSTDIFHASDLQMIEVGEQTGEIGQMHIQIAEHYEAEVDYDLQRLTDLIEPALTIGIGGMVLVLALAVYLPMWNLASGM
jgi:MSHA biogenesis protein MshG